MHNFDEIINRQGTDCAKWDGIGGQDVIPMWVADMDFKCAPEIIQALKERVEHGIFGYSGGYDSYYDAIINWMKKRFQWKVEKQWICTCPGIVSAINVLIRTLTNPGDKVIIQSPVYFPFSKAIKNNGCQVVDNALSFDGKKYIMDFDKLERQIDDRVKLMILCSPHNPVGRVWTKEELTKLGELCIKHNIIIISDEIHSDLVFKENKHTVFATISEKFAQNCIVCNAPSKTFNIAGIEASNIIIPNDRIRSAFKYGLESVGIGSPNVFTIPALKAAYNYGEQWLEEVLAYIKENYNFLKEYIEKNIPKVKVIESQGTFLVWLDFRELGLSNKELEQFVINNAKVYLNQGYTFGETGSGFLRMNIGCPRETLKEGLRRLEKAINKKL